MLKEEFLKLTGMEDIDDIEYQTYEQVYYDLPDMDKQTFCKLLMEKPSKIMEALDDRLAAVTARMRSEEARAKVLAEGIIEGKPSYDKAVNTLGMAETITLKVSKGIKLTDDEMDYLQRNLH